MKVLYLISGIGPEAGWGTEYIQNLIFKLSQKGIQATIINPIYKHTHPGWRRWSKEIEHKYQIKIISIESPTWLTQNLKLHFLLTPFIVTWQTFKLLSKERFDLIHEFSSTPVILLRAGLINLFLKTPTIFTLSVYNNTILGKFFWFGIFNFAKYLMIPSNEILTQLKKSGLNKNKLIFSPPGINLASFKPSSKTLARKILRLPQNKYIISYLGPLTSEKGVPEIIEAAKGLKPLVSQKILIFMSIIWKGSDEHQQLIKKIKLTNLDFLKIKEQFIDVQLLLSASDAVILPQRTGFGTTIPPISLLEALAAKRQVIAANIIGVRELINNNSDILIRPNHPNDLRMAFDKIRNMKYQENKLINQYDIKQSVKLHLNIYQKALK